MILTYGGRYPRWSSISKNVSPGVLCKPGVHGTSCANIERMARKIDGKRGRRPGLPRDAHQHLHQCKQGTRHNDCPQKTRAIPEPAPDTEERSHPRMIDSVLPSHADQMKFATSANGLRVISGTWAFAAG